MMTEMKTIKRFNTVLLLALFFNINLFAQIDKDVIVVKEYSPTISDAFKLNTMPSIKDTVSYKPVFTYNFLPLKINTNFEIEPIRPAKIKGEPLKKLYGRYVKLGFGSDVSPLVEIRVNKLRSRNIFWGIDAEHHSSHGRFSIDDTKYYPNFSDNSISLYGTKFLAYKDLSGVLNYKGNMLKYYGFNPIENEQWNKDSLTTQRFNLLEAGIRYKSDRISKSKIKYDYNLGYYLFFDNQKSTEHGASLKADFIDWYKDNMIAFNTAFNFYRRAVVGDTLDNFILKINPKVQKNGEDWKVTLGINTFAVIDPDANAETFFYPNLRFQYALADNFLLTYFGFTGKLDNNFYRNTASLNAFVRPDYEIRNTSHKKIIFAGVKGDISSKLSFDIKTTYSELANKLLFVQDTSFVDYHRFDVVYDTMDMVNVRAEVIFDTKAKFKFRLKANYYNYFNLHTELKAWNSPDYDLTLSTSYNIQNKIVLNADVYLIGKRYARDFDETGIVEAIALKEAVDINIGAKYILNSKVAGFINFNNIIAAKYYQWNYYPTQRFHVMLGINYSF